METLIADMSHDVDDLPGYRRRIRIEPCDDDGAVLAMLEDDMHCMAVTLRHSDGHVTAVEPVMERAPWTTCPGARAQLVATFIGLPLAEVTARRDKRLNCTHLHDLAVLAAAHARDAQALCYDILVSDPIEGERILELRRGGMTLLRWVERGGVLAEPAAVVGLTLAGLREWIAALPLNEQEPARLLQWASLVAHGRTIPLAQQSLASAMQATCYTFQPARAAVAERNGLLRDFSGTSSATPLDGFAQSRAERSGGA